MLLPEEQKADSFKKSLFLRFSEENKRRRILLAKEFQKLGANVLLARFELSGSEVPVSFEYRESEGISQLFIKIPAKKNYPMWSLQICISVGPHSKASTSDAIPASKSDGPFSPPVSSTKKPSKNPN
jgi:hypothetical protein